MSKSVYHGSNALFLGVLSNRILSQAVSYTWKIVTVPFVMEDHVIVTGAPVYPSNGGSVDDEPAVVVMEKLDTVSFRVKVGYAYSQYVYSS